jgi:hypothetical protein
MKWIPAGVLLLFIFAGCTPRTSSMGSASVRDRDYEINEIMLSPRGLTPEQIRVISSTKLPKSYPVDISILVVKDRGIDTETEYLFLESMMDGIGKSDKIGRIVPIPKLIFPSQLNFTSIQELGIRTLTEYVAIFVLQSESTFRSTKLVESKYKYTSMADFMLVDPQTTAIMASDRIYSENIYEKNLFKTGEEEKAKKELFVSQGRAVGELLANLFQ